MLGFFIRRVALAVSTALIGAIVVFGLFVFAPGDPAERVLTARGIQNPTPPAVAAVRAELQLDDPLWARFQDWFGGIITGDLGVSWKTGRPVAEDFLTRLPATAILTVAALGLAVALSLLLGLISAAWPSRWPDQLSRIGGIALSVLPSFLVGVLILDIVVVAMGHGQVISDGTWATVFLPAFTLAMGAASVWSRVLRAGLLEAFGATYLRVSVARGATRLRQLMVHQLPNALPPYLTMVGLGSAALLGGAPIVESVFTWPGVGRYVVQAISSRDMPVVAGFTILAVLVYVVTSLVLDLVVAWLDPRTRHPATRSRRTTATATPEPSEPCDAAESPVSPESVEAAGHR